MEKFIKDNFLLHSNIAEELYFDYAQKMPIIDYHNHLPPEEVANNINFKNLTAIWLHGDHYKWRALRANGIDEKYITGSASDEEKFQKWAETVPYTLRNPLYHWTHLELKRYFGIDTLLDANTAKSIYNEASSQLQQPSHSTIGLLQKMNVKVVCTTDDPLSSLEDHQSFAKNKDASFQMFPTFRPDKAIHSENIEKLNSYIDKLENILNINIESIDDYLSALKKRHDYFHENGCRLADHGLSHMFAEEHTYDQVHLIFERIRRGKEVSNSESAVFKSFMLLQIAEWHHEKGWVQQFHLGPIRNNNTRMLKKLGPDTGWDSIGDFAQASSLSKFLDRLDEKDKLAKTILYNNNPRDNEVFASMAGNFNDGSIIGKMQFGSGWWFLDQKQGIIDQLNALSNIGLLSRFVGMLTDSRSFLSFPRHEYFRRVLCNLLAEDILKGEIPHDINWVGHMIEDICYNNAKNYFEFK
ncbi:MAG TPA: glucuronate isomerase [Sphingobacterium sp.]|nr:glucuronate isomerase [Sphingobacterium sp.]